MKEKYLVKGSKKETFFDEHKSYSVEVTKEELIDLLNDPKTIVDSVQRKSYEL